METWRRFRRWVAQTFADPPAPVTREAWALEDYEAMAAVVAAKAVELLGQGEPYRTTVVVDKRYATGGREVGREVLRAEITLTPEEAAAVRASHDALAAALLRVGSGAPRRMPEKRAETAQDGAESRG